MNEHNTRTIHCSSGVSPKPFSFPPAQAQNKARMGGRHLSKKGSCHFILICKTHTGSGGPQGVREPTRG